MANFRRYWCNALLACALAAQAPLFAACGDDEKAPANPGAAGTDSDGGITAAGGTDSNGGTSGSGGSAGSAGTIAGSSGSGGSAVVPGDLVCSTDADCTGDKGVCDPVQGCVACLYDWDCPAQHRCEDRECFAKQPCETNADCTDDPEREVCDAVQQVCVGCREDSECSDGKRCQSNQCVAFEACTNSRDCMGGRVCERLIGACVDCVADGDCGEDSACVANSCVPACDSDRQCLGLGLLCDFELGRCVECLAHPDCPDQYFCSGGSCVLDVCEDSQTRCEDPHTLGTCSLIGDQFLNTTCAGDTLCQEEALTASCVPLACTPNSVRCSADAGSVITCNADGSAIVDVEPCSANTVCESAECVAVVCSPGTHSCGGDDGQTLYACNALGTQNDILQHCEVNYGQTCDEISGTCESAACFPNQQMCDDNVATVCAEDGSGPAPNGTDCTLLDLTCLDGSCQEIVCTGAYDCQDGELYTCYLNGTSEYQVDSCGSQALCDEVAGRCNTPQCAPGAFVCDGNVATRCKTDGSGYEPGGTNCAATNLVCDGGGCLPKVCTPNASFCEGGSPLRCSATGATYTPSDTCSASEYCLEGSTFCLLDKCTANAPTCNANVATTCASDGSGPLPGGTDCSASSQVCDAGTCKPVMCTPGSRLCLGEAVHTCSANGATTTLFQTCSTSAFCDSSSGTASCTVDICTAGALGCNGEVISTCGANGGSWTNPGTDCTASDQVCILGGTCAAQEIATQGSTSFPLSGYSGYLYLSGFRVLQDRKLSLLEVYGSVPGLQKFTWVVYEKRATSTTYDLVYQKVTAQKVATPVWTSSGTLDFVLEQGKTYAVGVHIDGPASVYYASSPLAQASFITASVGHLISGGTQPPVSTSLSSTSTRAHVRFTTVLAP